MRQVHEASAVVQLVLHVKHLRELMEQRQRMVSTMDGRRGADATKIPTHPKTGIRRRGETDKQATQSKRRGGNTGIILGCCTCLLLYAARCTLHGRSRAPRQSPGLHKHGDLANE
ncbi:hypothetical protein J3458_000608 [Metarhizium acridum]|uniref:uncharacterized protein n=1 Tax=Metarhizium acridum TaxID=92637 RepID=UPI001C6CBC2C|nr:hypothetical protein J3458_000608 [Metarhizium acridum]